MNSDTRAALITGGSSGIGLAIARALGRDGYGVTLSARRPEKLDSAAQTLVDEGIEAHSVAANMADEDDIKKVVAGHRERFGRIDVLINNAGIGIGSAVADTETKKLDFQLYVNLRAVYLVARECIPISRRRAPSTEGLIANTASIDERAGRLAGAFGYKFGGRPEQAMHKELSSEGIQVTALCPGFVATAMTDWVEGQVPKEKMIQPEDIAESVRFLLRTSPHCLVPEVQFIRPGDSEG